MPWLYERALWQKGHVPDGPRASIFVYKAHTLGISMTGG
jgi:hypothetical protein